MQSSLFSLLLLGLLLQWVTAAPTQLRKRTFKVERARNAHFRGHNGPRELLKAYRKYSMPVPHALLDAMRAQEAAKHGLNNTQSKMGGGHGGGQGGPQGGMQGGPQGGGPGGAPGGRGGPQGGPPAGLQGGFPCPCCANGNPQVVESEGDTVVIVWESEPGQQPENQDPQPEIHEPQPQPQPSQDSEPDDGGIIGIVTATPEDGDIEYLSPVTIGGQTLNLDFDTGSADLWVFNTQLPDNLTRGHQLFDPSQSRTFKMLDGASFSITYGDESGAAGNVGIDVVDIGGVVVENQAVELATDVSSSFVEDVGSHGLLGLAYSKLNTVQPQQQKTFFDNVLPTLAEPLFTADLRRGEVGAYEFGRIDTSKFVGEMAWIPVNTTNGFWQFATSGFAVGNEEAMTGLPTSQAIADTGTTLMIVSKEVSDGYYSQVSGARNDEHIGGMAFPCDAQLPDLFVDVGGLYVARVKGQDINFAQVSEDTCFGGIQPSTSPGDLQIWGDVFFKSQFVAFNGGDHTLGMAQHV
ncbi:aspartic peptidase domain-containing protein [Podospora aff. communis PSN243]|uniref:Aspartic peptidase domain-containing protein n=1 Tax=Podospora aff. communis PSN243 TaxID=3040156 RepID=A0AAV9GGM1_9PEZI|nr:aspartic peptidase domain-containing protein [Podospora aff. communis PSN243]